MFPLSRTLTRALVFARLLIVTLALLIIFHPLALIAKPTVSHAASNVITITLNQTTFSYPVSPDFLGFSIEVGNVCSILKLDHDTTTLAQLFETLGPGVMRFGGSTVEYTSWNPHGSATCGSFHTVINQSLLDRLFAFAREVGWKVMWTVDLKNYDLAQFTAEAAYAAKAGGSSLLSIEFGNEPNLYGITYSKYLKHWLAYYKAFRALAPNTPVSGPSIAKDQWFNSFLRDEGSKLTIATAHMYYGLGGGKHPPDITMLLSPLSMLMARTMFHTCATEAQKYNLPMEFNEANNYHRQGQSGVSNVFASALWGADYLFTALENGVTRMNFHGVPNTISGNSKSLPNYYSPINSPDIGDVSAAPLYYGMAMFHYAAADRQVVPLQIMSSLNVTAHAVLGKDGKLHLVILNKEPAKSVKVNIDTTQSYSSATLISLQAPALDSTTGITLGGSPVLPNGTWAPTQIGLVPVHGENSTVTLPPGSGVVITYAQVGMGN